MKRIASRGVIVSLALLTVLALTGFGRAGNSSGGWTQWGGPQKNFLADSKGLSKEGPEEGPPQLWSRCC